MEQLIYAKAVVEKGSDDTMRIIASTEAIDRDGEIIKLSGWDLKAFKSNPVFLWAHNHRDLPLGKFLSITNSKANKRLEGVIKWASEEANPFAKFVKAQFEEGLMNNFSVGFIPKERDVNEPNIITKAELLEVSAVPVPSNPGAMALLTAKGFGDKKDLITFDPTDMRKYVNADKYNPTQLADFINEKWGVFKTVVPFKSYKLLDKGSDWNIKNVGANLKAWATGDEDRINFADYRKAFAWVNENKAESIASYKFAHHDYQNELVTNWRGLTLAMANLLGEDGVDIPEVERKRVYDHLAKHYREFKEEAPKFKEVEEKAFSCQCLDCDHKFTSEKHCNEVKCPKCGGKCRRAGRPGVGREAGTQLTKEYKEKIRDSISTLQDLLNGSEKALENGNSMYDLSDSDKEDVKTNLKIAKLLSEMIMRNLNKK